MASNAAAPELHNQCRLSEEPLRGLGETGMNRESGLTLFEIMVVIIIIFIISATSIPILSRTIGVFRVKSGAETLGTKLNLARQESVRRGTATNVFFDPSTSKMYVDLNHNNKPEGSANADVVAGRILNE